MRCASDEESASATVMPLTDKCVCLCDRDKFVCVGGARCTPPYLHMSVLSLPLTLSLTHTLCMPPAEGLAWLELD